MNEIKIDTTTIITHGNNHVAANLEDKVMMMSVQQGNYYGLDTIGSRIWKLIEQPHSITAVCDTLLEEFEVDREICERDLLMFVQQLAKENLIKVVS